MCLDLPSARFRSYYMDHFLPVICTVSHTNWKRKADVWTKQMWVFVGLLLTFPVPLFSDLPHPGQLRLDLGRPGWQPLQPPPGMETGLLKDKTPHGWVSGSLHDSNFHLQRKAWPSLFCLTEEEQEHPTSWVLTTVNINVSPEPWLSEKCLQPRTGRFTAKSTCREIVSKTQKQTWNWIRPHRLLELTRQYLLLRVWLQAQGYRLLSPHFFTSTKSEMWSDRGGLNKSIK